MYVPHLVWARGEARDCAFELRKLCEVTRDPELAKWSKEMELEARALFAKLDEKERELRSIEGGTP